MDHAVYGKCKEITEQMAKKHPELTRVRGHYHCPIWGKRAHWWLKDEQGNIVDPTAAQFPSRGGGKYEEWDESKIEPTGKCLDCGGDAFNGDTFCSSRCEAATARFMAIENLTFEEED